MKALHGLSTVNIELTSRCNKACWMCGRRKREKEDPQIISTYGDMDFQLVRKIAHQLPPGIVVQFHNNGEPLLYPRFGEAVKLFENQIRCVDTNAKLIVEKANEIIGNLHTITISAFEDDPDAEEQYRLVKKFIKLKGYKPPFMVYRLLGQMGADRWKRLPGIIARRTLHNPMGSYGYSKERVKPEIGVCLEALHHPAIDRYGNVSLCVRYDPHGLMRLGNLRKDSLKHIWESPLRGAFVDLHVSGDRDLIPFCSKCEYWGIPG